MKGEKDYGQIYWSGGTGDDFIPSMWRGTIWLYDEHGGGRAGWEGQHRDTPDEAFTDMATEAKKHGVTDLRRWSGAVPA